MFRSTRDSQPVPPTRQRAIGALAALLLALLVAFLPRGEGSAPSTQTATNSTSSGATPADTVAVGRQLYATHCAACHGANLQGAGGGGAHAASPLNATSPARQRSDDWLFRTIRDGGQATAPPGETNLMPAMGASLSDAQIWAVIAFLKHEWSATTG